jgi:DNA-binding transcriptional ArsR family regulator
MAKPGRQRESERGKEPDLRLIKALSHPLRWRILQTLNLRVASPTELAGELGAPLPNIAYHVKVLAQNDAIELVKTQQVRGALEHFYRATMRPWFTDDLWAELPVSARRALFTEILRDTWADVAASAEAGQLDDPTTHITRTWLDLDRPAYDEIVDSLNALVERALELHAETAPRLAALPDSEREEHRTAMMLMHFHRAPTAEPGALHGGRVEKAQDPSGVKSEGDS